MLLTREEHQVVQRAKGHTRSNKVGPMSCGGLWGKVRRYPGRVVSVHTAIRRIEEGESLQKACTRPPEKASGRQPRSYQNNPQFLRDVKGPLSARYVAGKWGVSESCIFKRRQQLRASEELYEQAT